MLYYLIRLVHKSGTNPKSKNTSTEKKKQFIDIQPYNPLKFFEITHLT